MYDVLEKSLYEHLDELRSRLIVVGIVLVLFFLVGLFVAPSIIRFMKDDLILSNNVQIIATSPVEFISAEIRIAMLVSIVLSFPVILYEAVVFVKPGLTPSERYALKLIIPSFVLLFICGVVFAYFVFIKVALLFLANLATISGIANLWSLAKFSSFVFYIALALGLTFQLPLLMVMLRKFGIINLKLLASKRRYVYVAMLVLSAVITPPDVVTQLIVALPLIALYEVSLIVANFF